jgi:hypothetical protein
MTPYMLITAIPDVIWAAVTGAALTLFGVLLVNRSNTKRLELQLKADALENDKNRLAALRKEVYLQAPKEAAKAMAYLGSLSSRDLAKIGNDQGISEFSAVAAQIAVLSDMDTVRAVMQFSQVLTATFVDSLAELHEVQDTRQDIELLQGRLDLLQQDISRIQADQQHASELGNSSPGEDAGRKFWIDARTKEFTEVRLELNALRAQHQRALHEYHKRFMGKMPSLVTDNMNMMIAVRNELGLQGDAAAFEAEMQKVTDELRSKFLAMSDEWARLLEAEED